MGRHLLNKFGEQNVNMACVVQEKHQNGGYHLHAVVELLRECDFQNCEHYFDLDNYHPHFKTVRSWPGCLRYIDKEDETPWEYNVRRVMRFKHWWRQLSFMANLHCDDRMNE